MTVCIAAFAGQMEEIVLVTDSKVTFGDYSADRAVHKQVPFMFAHVVQFAGNDVARAGPVMARARKRLQDTKNPSTDGIAETIFEECKRERDRVADAKVLGKHGFDSTFRTNGKDLCTSEIFYDLHAKLEQVTLSLDFILAGFDEANQPHIRFTNAEIPPEDYDLLGFYAIGSGANAALASLAHAVEHLHFSRWGNTEEAVYQCLAAKFMAESATDVGEDTDVVVGKKNGPTKFFSGFGAADLIRNEWEKKGAPRIPKGITEVIKDLLITGDNQLEADALARQSKHLRDAKKFQRAVERAKALSAAKKKAEELKS